MSLRFSRNSVSGQKGAAASGRTDTPVSRLCITVLPTATTRFSSACFRPAWDSACVSRRSTWSRAARDSAARPFGWAMVYWMRVMTSAP